MSTQTCNYTLDVLKMVLKESWLNVLPLRESKQGLMQSDNYMAYPKPLFLD